MNITTKLQLKAFIEASNIKPSLIKYSDYQTAKANKAIHIRKGLITDGEGKGTPVHALYWDALGNTVALCQDGFVRQFH